MPNGPHRHQVTYVPAAIVEYLKQRLPFENSTVPLGEIDEAEQAKTDAKALFANWAIEQNACRLATILTSLGRNKEARELRDQADQVREVGKRMFRAIIAPFEAEIKRVQAKSHFPTQV